MHRIVITLLLVGFAFILDAQNFKPSEEASRLSSVPVDVMPVQDNKFLLQNELNQRVPGRPIRFAKAINTSITTKQSGQWEQVKSNYLVWRARVHSSGARSLNLGFTKFFLPKSAKLFIYDPAQTEVFGPFTHKDNDAHRQLWTPIIKSDQLVIELQISESEVMDLELELTHVNHDFIGIFESPVSGSCNVDVACGSEDGFPDVDLYRDIITSVGAYTLNGIDQCTGVLINNTANDCTPYFLTAQHCGITASNGPSVVVYWNYENSYCRPPNTSESGQIGDGQRNQFNSGAREVADYPAADMSLILLDDPIDPLHGLTAAGWSRSTALDIPTVAIHHPQVEEKRISFDYDPAAVSHPDLPNINVGTDTSYVIVSDWDVGTTEGGSSGSPLFNRDGQIIGQLFGGFAACGNDEYDYYGWIGKSWEGGGTAATQLKAWLDPKGENPLTLESTNCSAFIDASNQDFEICTTEQDSIEIDLSVGGSFDSLVYLSVNGVPDQANASLTKDSISLEEQTVLLIENLASLTDTNFVVTILATDGVLDAQLSINIILRTSSPQVPELMSPENEVENYLSTPVFSWSGQNAEHFEIQLAETENFDTPIFSEITQDNQLRSSLLEEEKTYYWRVRASNACGTSAWSTVYSFTVGNEKCVEYIVSGLPLLIPEIPGNYIHKFDVDSKVTVSSLRVTKIKGTHTWVSDLIVSIKNPSGDQSTLFQNICSSFFGEEDFDLGFDDNAGLTNPPCPPTDSQIYKPASPLAALSNKSAFGEWELLVEDTEDFDGGEVEELSLEICFYSSSAATLVPKTNLLSYCEGDELLIETFLYDFDPTELIISNNGNMISYSSEANQNEGDVIDIVLLDPTSINKGINEIHLTSDANNIDVVVYLDYALQATPVEILTPEQGSVIPINLLDQISWTDNPVNDSYILEIALDNDFTDIIFSESYTTTAVDFPSNLEADNNYFLRIRSINSCGEAVRTTDFFVEGPSSVSNISGNKIKVFPNPATEELNIQSENRWEVINFKLYNTLGNLIQNGFKTNSLGFKVNLKDLEPGSYLLELRTKDESFVEKIIVH